MKKHLRGLLAVAFTLSLFLGVTGAASAEPITTQLSPEADNWTNSCPSGNAMKNGTIASGGNRAKEVRLRGWSNGPRAFRTLARFDLTSLAGKTVQSATLRFYWFGGEWETPTTQQVVELYEQTDAWEEGNSNWRYGDDPAEWTSVDPWNPTAPYYSGPGGTQGGSGTLGDLVDATVLLWTGTGSEADWVNFPGEWVEFDVTDTVQGWVNGDPNHGFAMVLQDEVGGGATVYRMYSRECTDCDEGQKPLLEVTYDGAEAWGAPPAASTVDAAPGSHPLNYLLMLLVPAALLAGFKRVLGR
jgi:hypothetical protein